MTRRDDLPSDLARPRGTRGWLAGVIVGGALLALDVALLAYALATWHS